MSWLVLTSLDRYTMALPRWFEMLLVEVIVLKVCTPNPVAACEAKDWVKGSMII